MRSICTIWFNICDCSCSKYSKCVAVQRRVFNNRDFFLVWFVDPERIVLKVHGPRDEWTARSFWSLDAFFVIMLSFQGLHCCVVLLSVPWLHCAIMILWSYYIGMWRDKVEVGVSRCIVHTVVMISVQHIRFGAMASWCQLFNRRTCSIRHGIILLNRSVDTFRAIYAYPFRISTVQQKYPFLLSVHWYTLGPYDVILQVGT